MGGLGGLGAGGGGDGDGGGGDGDGGGDGGGGGGGEGTTHGLLQGHPPHLFSASGVNGC